MFVSGDDRTSQRMACFFNRDTPAARVRTLSPRATFHPVQDLRISVSQQGAGAPLGGSHPGAARFTPILLFLCCGQHRKRTQLPFPSTQNPLSSTKTCCRQRRPRCCREKTPPPSKRKQLPSTKTPLLREGAAASLAVKTLSAPCCREGASRHSAS